MPASPQQTSPATQPWAPDYAAIIRERVLLMNRMRNNPAIIDAMKIVYKNDIVAFVRDWAWTYDPRRKDGSKWMPMVLWPKQEEFLLWLVSLWEAGENGVVDKNRGAGATWLAVWCTIWFFLFHEGIKIGWGSRKQDLVDNLGDPDSIFEKMRMGIGRLPPELLPYGWEVAKNTTYLKLRNPINETTVTGEAGDNIGRGGRNSIYFIDESAFLERPSKIEASLLENTDVRIDISTHSGVGNPFYLKTRNYPAHRRFVFDWFNDPRKTQEWYDKKKAETDPLVYAQEVDRDPGASAENVVIPFKWVQAAIQITLKPYGDKIAGLDVADEGPDANAFVERHGCVVQQPISWKQGTTTQTAQRATLLCDDKKIRILRYDRDGVGAGVRGELGQGKGNLLHVEGIRTGGGATAGWYIPRTEDEPGKKNKDMFYNLKAQGWWGVRERCRKTYEVQEGIRAWPADELIDLPANAHQLHSELSSQRYEMRNGKILIVSKKIMKAQHGVKSPNEGDAVILCFAPDPPTIGVW